MAVKYLMYLLMKLILISKGMTLKASMSTFRYQGNLFGFTKYEIVSDVRPSILSCARLCSTLATCTAMGYNKEQSYCIAYNAPNTNDLIYSGHWMFYIREKDTPHTDSYCPKDWTKGTGKCYWLSENGNTKNADATENCKHMNANILNIQSEAEQREVEKLLRSNADMFSNHAYVWIGGKVNHESTVPQAWWGDPSNNQSINLQKFNYWGKGQPVPQFQCVAIFAFKAAGLFGRWYNKDCEQTMPYICEISIK